MREIIVKDCFSSVEKFNNVAGNATSLESIANQLLRCKEELEETMAAIFVDNEGVHTLRSDVDQLELLDGVCDLHVVVLGLISKMEDMGYEVLDALTTVCENNLTKFVKTVEEANETAVMYEEQGIPVDIRYSKQYDVFAVVRKLDGKVMKPKGYQSVTLDEFLPKEN